MPTTGDSARELDIFDSDPLIGCRTAVLAAGRRRRTFTRSKATCATWNGGAGYQYVYSPVLGKRALYERSGHWEHFADDMFPPMAMSADDELVLRPTMVSPSCADLRIRDRGPIAICRYVSPKSAASIVPSVRACSAVSAVYAGCH